MNRGKLIFYVAVTCIILVTVGIILFSELGDQGITKNPDIGKMKNPVRNSVKKSNSEIKSKLQARKDRLRSKKMSSPKFSNKGLVEIDVISEQISRLENPNAKIDLLNQLWEIDNPALAKLVMEQLNDKNEEVRLAALELLDNKKQGEILACIEKAMDDPDEKVREFAVILLGDTDEKQNTQSLLLKGVDDSSEDVRAATFDVLGMKNAKEQEYVFSQSIASPYNDVKENTLDLLMDIPSHSTIKILFHGLNDQDEDFREMVKDKIHFLITQEFDNYNDAIAWWEKNKNKFDDELFEK